MDLEKTIKEFIDGRIEIEDIVKRYEFNVFHVIKFIEKYYKYNKLEISDDVNERINNTLINIYNLKANGANNSFIIKTYYCNKHNIEKLVKEVKKYKEITDDKKEKEIKEKKKMIYKLRLEGVSYDDISKKCNLSLFKTRSFLFDYCKENNLPVPKNIVHYKAEPKLTIEEIYNLRLEGLPYDKLGSICDVSSSYIRTALFKYCEKNNLPFPRKKRLACKDIISMQEVLDLRKLGTTYSKIGKTYGYSETTIRSNLLKYLYERLATDLQQINEKNNYIDDLIDERKKQL